MRGLIIHKEWLDKIVSGEKSVEIRTTPTQFLNEDIYLLESGSHKVRAVCRITKCYPINTMEEWIKLNPRHCVQAGLYEAQLYRDKRKTLYAWELELVTVIKEERYFEYKRGHQIWVKEVNIL